MAVISSVAPSPFGSLETRREEVGVSPVLRALAERLARLVTPLREGPVYIPEAKALLSRDGGVCGDDGSRLVFDPYQPHQHRCPQCDRVFDGERHHRAWVWRYHLWLSERAVHLALLDALGCCPGGVGRAVEIVAHYAARYTRYPNADNVLGPTRLFFSTYQESIWLIQLVIAAGLARQADATVMGADTETAVAAMVEESAGLIRSFDERWSNRQVWNNAALIAAGAFLGDVRLVASGRDGRHGIVAQLERAVSPDGRWIEGENYHFFALRGFALAAELLIGSGENLYERTATARLGKMYSAPLAAILPDLTMPARGDSPFGVTVQQPRFAELWEMGRRRTRDPVLGSLLTELYAADGAVDDSGEREIAEVEQNRPPTKLERAQLGYKALLWMPPEEPNDDPEAWRRDSVLVAPTGPAVLRPGPGRYVSLECGGGHTGHGHPDMLHLTVFDGRPWLLDFGTGSYVVESLHWYRSTLCHNAPGLVGVGQRRKRGWCSGFGRRGEWHWCRGRAFELFGPEFTATRNIVAGPQYILDVLDLAAPDDAVIDLPIHPLGAIALDADVVRRPADNLEIFGGVGHEHGYDAVVAAHQLEPIPSTVCAVAGGDECEIHLVPREHERLFLAEAPGPPSLALGPSGYLPFLVRRAPGRGRWVQVFTTTRGLIDEVGVDGDGVEVRHTSGVVDQFVVRTDGVFGVLGSGMELSFTGDRPEPGRVEPPVVPPPRLLCSLLREPPRLVDALTVIDAGSIIHLTGDDYRRSELPYPGETQFSARVGLGASGTRIYFALEVRKPTLVLRPRDAADPQLDNECPDIHSDGVQCYLGWGSWAGYLIVPVTDTGQIRVRPVPGTAANAERIAGAWRRTPIGYDLLISVDVGEQIAPGREFLVNAVINEMHPGRERRAGQLVLVGGGGWTYLRGDREDPAAAAVAEVR